MSYFELFGLPVSLQVDKNQLAQRYFELQKQYHPDFYTHADEAAKAEALEISSQVNRAFNTFRNGDETIKYVLQLKGLLQEEEKYELPPAFLMEMMELNEALADGGEDTARRIGATEEELYGEVKDLIEGYKEDSTPQAALAQVKEYYFKKKYLERLKERIRNIATR